jgi:hypothetical protein
MSIYPEDGSIGFHLNVDTDLSNYTLLQPRKVQFLCNLACEISVSHGNNYEDYSPLGCGAV